QVEAIDARIDLIDGALLVRKLRLLDNRRHCGRRLAQDPAVTDRIVQNGGQERRGGIACAMSLDKGLQRLCMDERGITGQNERQLDLADGPPRHKHRMARAALWVLKDRLDIERAPRPGNVVAMLGYGDP